MQQPTTSLLQRAVRTRVWSVLRTPLSQVPTLGAIFVLFRFAQIFSSPPDLLAGPLGPLLVLGVGLLMVGLAMLIHRLGSVAALWLTQARILWITVGPLMVERTGGRLRVGLNNKGFWFGLASFPTRADDLRRNMRIEALGGPGANLVAVLLALAALPLLSGPAFYLTLAFALNNLTFVVAELLPLHRGGWNAGALLLDLWKGGPEIERRRVLVAIQALALTRRPRDWPPELLAAALALPDRSHDDLFAHGLAYDAALDRGDDDAMLRHMSYVQAHLDGCPKELRRMLLLEGAYFCARRGDWSTARSYLDQSRGGQWIKAHTYDRVEAAVLLAEGQPAQARTAARRALAALTAEEQTPVVLAELDLVHALLGQTEAPALALPK